MATVSTIGTLARNYSTVPLWYSAYATGGWEGDCYNDTEFLVTASITFSGKSPSATNYVLLTTGAGQSFSDAAGALTNPIAYNRTNGVGFRTTTNYVNGIFVLAESTGACTISKIQMFSNANNGQIVRDVTSPSAPNVVQQCIMEETSQSGTTATCELFNTNLLNSAIINLGAAGNAIRINYGSSAIINNTIIRTSNRTAADIAFNINGAHPVITNNMVFGYATFNSGSGTPTGSNNCSDVAIGFGSANQASKTFANQFVNSTQTGTDVSLKTGSDGINNGSTATTYIPGAVDINGTSRPQGTSWCIGCKEYKSSSTTVSGAGTAVGLATVAGVGRGRHATVGTATGLATVAGVGKTLKRSVGAATGLAVVAGVGKAVTLAHGTAVGAASAAGVGLTIKRSAGTANGVATASAVSAATKRAVGTAVGVASAAGSGLDLLRTAGTAIGVASANAVGKGVSLSHGTAVGIATASAHGATIEKTTGTAVGVASASAVSKQTNASHGTAVGVASAAGVGKTLKESHGTAVGVASASGVSRAVKRAAGTAVGLAIAQGVNAGGGVVPSTGTAVGLATSGAVGRAVHKSAGTAIGLATASAVGRAVHHVAGTAVGIATAAGVGHGVSRSVGTAVGVAQALASSTNTKPAVGTAVGVATASAVGAILHIVPGVGTAIGIATAQGVGARAIFPTPWNTLSGPPRVRVLEGSPRVRVLGG